MQADKLLPCPFCGGAAKLIESVDTGEKYGGPSWKVACESPMTPCVGGFINLWQCTPEDAVAAWNRRPSALLAIAEGAEADRAEVAILRNNLEAQEACTANVSEHFDRLNDRCALLTMLLDEVRRNFTRDDAMPHELLPRIHATIYAATTDV